MEKLAHISLSWKTFTSRWFRNEHLRRERGREIEREI